MAIYLRVRNAVCCVVPTVMPIATIADPELRNNCPNQGNGLTKIIGFILGLYFVVLTVSLCLNKLRGLGFLKNFVNLGLI